MQARHTDLPKQKILHNLQQRSLYRIQQLTTDHTVRRCTCISEADLDISIKGKGRGGTFYFQKPFFFFLLNIKRYRDVIQSENYKTWQKEN
jgi:hypothetical protein